MRLDGEKRFLTSVGSARAATEIAISLYKIPVLLTTWTRCGKPRCRCNAGHLHGPYHALHWRDGATQRRRYVRAADVPDVRTILEKRRRERNLHRLAFALSLHASQGLDQLLAEVEAQLREEREQS
jgi:hypothetical protein